MTKPGWSQGACDREQYEKPRRWHHQLALGGSTYVLQSEADAKVSELLRALRALEAKLEAPR